MLTNEMMGCALLALSWLTALMIALDARHDASRLHALKQRWKSGLWHGKIVSELFASHQVEQRVKELDSPKPALIFFDRAHRSELALESRIDVDGEVLQVETTPELEVWFDDARRQQAVREATASQFDELATLASKPGGGIREIKTSMARGDSVWVAGERKLNLIHAHVISSFDPRLFVNRRQWRIAGLLVANVVWIGFGTALVFASPGFGTSTKIGAVVLLAHFLGMTPLAMASREKSRTPAFGFLRGEMKRPRPLSN